MTMGLNLALFREPSLKQMAQFLLDLNFVSACNVVCNGIDWCDDIIGQVDIAVNTAQVPKQASQLGVKHLLEFIIFNFSRAICIRLFYQFLHSRSSAGSSSKGGA